MSVDDESGRRVPGGWVRELGELRLTYLPDGDIEVWPTGFFTSTTEDDWAARPEAVTDAGQLAVGAGALLVERGGTRVLLDAGLGPLTMSPDDTPPAFGAWRGGGLPDACAAAGVDPAGIDLVAFTHLHADHVGWATPWAVAGERSLFPDATWVLGTGERGGPHCGDDVVPAGNGARTREVGDGDEVAPGVRAWALPGHTSGHTAWVLDTGDGRRVVAFGDAMHNPAQIEHPEWTVVVDHDAGAAESARRALIEELARPGSIGFGVHFSDRQLGRVADGRWTTELG